MIDHKSEQALLEPVLEGLSFLAKIIARQILEKQLASVSGLKASKQPEDE